MNSDPTAKSLHDLAHKFETGLDYYKSGKYNEQECRLEFIDEFLEILGWDVRNSNNVEPEFREVKIENYTNENSERPDYSMTLRGITKFFIEAKKPSVDILESKESALQSRKYGWNARHPFSVLTNYEYLVIYDTTFVPTADDEPVVARYAVFNYKEYETRYSEIKQILSRETIYSGHFEDVCKELFPSTEHYKISVDKLFLEQINRWRVKIANDLIKHERYRNSNILNDVVQSFINEIVFLRICEDKHLPTKETLFKATSNIETIPENLDSLMKNSDKLYNSGIFKKGSIVHAISPKLLKEIIGELYYPRSPYLFNIIDLEILGIMYESFLTESLFYTDGKVVLRKKEEFKDRSVVSTPHPIVRYIISESMSKACSLKNPSEIMKMKFGDFACGSGIFLVEVFDFLINYLENWYRQNDSEHLRDSGFGSKLPFEEKRELLINCIRGVDIDIHAVEIAKFSLLIKLLDYETEMSLLKYKPVLPNLDELIVEGNALLSRCEIDPYSPTIDDLKEIKPFNWDDLLDGSKFDVIVGNPPYSKTEDMINLLNPLEMNAYKGIYTTPSRQFDKYFLFIERGINLLKESGYMCLIVPNKFFKIVSGNRLRRLIANNKLLVRIDDFGSIQLFEDKTTYCAIILFQKKSHSKFTYVRQKSIDLLWGSITDGPEIPSDFITDKPWMLTMDEQLLDVLSKLRNISVPLGDVVNIFNGIQTSAERPPIYWFGKDEIISENGDFLIVVRNNKRYSLERGILRPYFKPVKNAEKGMNSYSILSTDKWIIFPYDREGRLIPIDQMKSRYPNTYAYLLDYYEQLVPKCVSPTGRRDVPGATEDTWYQYGRTQALSSFTQPKLIVGILSKEPMYVYDDRNMLIASGGTAGYCAITTNDNSPYDILYIQAWLSNPMTEKILRAMGSDFDNNFESRGTSVLKEVPFIPLNFKDPKDVHIHNEIVQISKKILDLNQIIKKTSNSSELKILINEKMFNISKIEELISSVYSGSYRDEIKGKQQ